MIHEDCKILYCERSNDNPVVVVVVVVVVFLLPIGHRLVYLLRYSGPCMVV